MKLTPREAVSGFTDIHKFDVASLIQLGIGATIKIATIPPGGIITSCAIYIIQPPTGGGLNVSFGTNSPDYNNLGLIDVESPQKCSFDNGSAFQVVDGGDVFDGVLNGFVNNSNENLPVYLLVVAEALDDEGNPPADGSGLVCMRILEPSVFNF